MTIDKIALDRWITREPDSSYDIWVEKVFDQIPDKNWDLYEEDLLDGKADELLNGLFDLDSTFEDPNLAAEILIIYIIVFGL